ncbi:NADH-quinone oxidoreductase subunit A, partial [uncultured Muribaculum sp.]
AQFKVGYYLYAILFLMFDVETVFLYPWAVNMHTLGTDGLLCIAVFFGILVLGLVYAWRKGALEWK